MGSSSSCCQSQMTLCMTRMQVRVQGGDNHSSTLLCGHPLNAAFLAAPTQECPAAAQALQHMQHIQNCPSTTQHGAWFVLCADEADEAWAVQQRSGRTTDAILSCPGCFTTLCIDCQQHELYHTQVGGLALRVQPCLRSAQEVRLSLRVCCCSGSKCSGLADACGPGAFRRSLVQAMVLQCASVS